MYTHILIATDGSYCSDRCVDQGLALAKALGCKVTIATVTAPYSSAGVFGGIFHDEHIVGKYNESWKKFAENVLEKARDRAEKLDVDIISLHLVNPLPSDAILKAADSIRCDLIVVGTHGYSGARRLLLGSQANKIITLSDKSVLIIK